MEAINLVGPHGYIHGWIKVGSDAHTTLDSLRYESSSSIKGHMDAAWEARQRGDFDTARRHLGYAADEALKQGVPSGVGGGGTPGGPLYKAIKGIDVGGSGDSGGYPVRTSYSKQEIADSDEMQRLWWRQRAAEDAGNWAESARLDAQMKAISSRHPQGWSNALDAIELSARTAMLERTPAPAGKPGGPGLYDIKGMGHSDYFQQVVKALKEKRGMPGDKAYRIAWGAMRKWSRGGGHVHPEVRAAAGRSLAEEEAKATRARAAHGHASTGPAIELDWRTEKRGEHGEWVGALGELAGKLDSDHPGKGLGDHVRQARDAVQRGDIDTAGRHLQAAQDTLRGHEFYTGGRGDETYRKAAGNSSLLGDHLKHADSVASESEASRGHLGMFHRMGAAIARNIREGKEPEEQYNLRPGEVRQGAMFERMAGREDVQASKGKLGSFRNRSGDMAMQGIFGKNISPREVEGLAGMYGGNKPTKAELKRKAAYRQAHGFANVYQFDFSEAIELYNPHELRGKGGRWSTGGLDPASIRLPGGGRRGWTGQASEMPGRDVRRDFPAAARRMRLITPERLTMARQDDLRIKDGLKPLHPELAAIWPDIYKGIKPPRGSRLTTPKAPRIRHDPTRVSGITDAESDYLIAAVKTTQAYKTSTSFASVCDAIELYNPAGNPGQARVPSGQAGGGQFTVSGSGSGSTVAPKGAQNKPGKQTSTTRLINALNKAQLRQVLMAWRNELKQLEALLAQLKSGKISASAAQTAASSASKAATAAVPAAAKAAAASATTAAKTTATAAKTTAAAAKTAAPTSASMTSQISSQIASLKTKIAAGNARLAAM